MSFGYPAGNPGNTFVASFDATGDVVVSYSRNPKDFSLNQYIKLIPVKESAGYFLQLAPNNANRIIASNNADNAWGDGNDEPTGSWNAESFQFVKYATLRYAYPFRLGYKAVQQAVWKILAQHAAICAQQAMTARTLLVSNLIESANWGSNTGTFASLNVSGAFANQGTATNQVLKEALTNAAIAINKATIGTVRPKDLLVVFGPDAALAISLSAEIGAYLQQSPFALAQVMGNAPNQNGLWGLPEMLYGFKIVIEDAVRNTAIKDNANIEGYIKAKNTAWMLARPGALVGIEGAPSFSTVHIHAYEEMTVESKDDSDNRRHKGRVVDDFSVDMVSNLSGYLITNLFS